MDTVASAAGSVNRRITERQHAKVMFNARQAGLDPKKGEVNQMVNRLWPEKSSVREVDAYAELDQLLAEIEKFKLEHTPTPTDDAPPAGIKLGDREWMTRWHTPQTLFDIVNRFRGPEGEWGNAVASYLVRVRNGADAGAWELQEFIAWTFRLSLPQGFRIELRRQLALSGVGDGQ